MVAKTESTEKQRKAIKRRQEYEELLKQHPKIKALYQEKTTNSEQPLKRGVPKLIAEAMQNEEFAQAIIVVRRKYRYEYEIDDLTHRRLQKETISLDSEIKLIREGDAIEQDIRKTLGPLTRKVRLVLNDNYNYP